MSLPQQLTTKYNNNGLSNNDFAYLNLSNNVNNMMSSMYRPNQDQDQGQGPSQQISNFKPVPQLALGSGFNGSNQWSGPIYGQDPNGTQNGLLQTGFNPYYYAQYPTNSITLPGPVTKNAYVRYANQVPISSITKNNINGIKNLREPTINNPVMNVPIDAYNVPQLYKDYVRYDNGDGPTASSEQVRSEVDKTFVNRLFQNPADTFFERNNSQRQWYSEPNGSVPNDQTSFAENLYGVDYVCKAGSINMRYGVSYTDDSLVCNGANAAEPTNFGQL